LLNADVGIIQLPCPELLYLGLDREVDVLANPTVESEDTRIALRMAEKDSLDLCRKIAESIVHQVKEYIKYGFEITGLVGVNGSPTCGVETTWAEDRELKGPGVFIRLLEEELSKSGLTIRTTGIKAREPEQAVMAVGRVINSKDGLQDED
jgi:predicted secreted protein